MRITILCNDRSIREDIQAEHGFSCLIQNGRGSVLFDTGDTGMYLENARKIGVDLSEVRHVVLSHAHYDHSGGFLAFAAQQQSYELLVHRRFFTPKYWDEDPCFRFVGNRFTPESLCEKGVPFFLIKTDTFPLGEDRKAWLLSRFPRVTAFEVIEPAAYQYAAGDFLPDTFEEELVYAADTADGLVIVSGCSHSGIANICEEAQKRLNRPICAVIGGTHLISAQEKQQRDTIAYFNAHPKIRLLAPVHCTGDAALEAFRQQCPAYHPVGAGSVIELA